MPTTQDVDKILDQEKELFFKKLADYGTEDINKVGIDGVINRVIEKAERAKHLIGQGVAIDEHSAQFESLRDTFLDLIGYSLIATLLCDGKWSNRDEYLDKIMIVRTEAAKKFDLPRPKKEGDVGFDLYTVKDCTIEPNQQLPVDIPTGTKVRLPKGKWALIINRSSTPRKMGIEVVPGVIDNGYTGELFACCFNRTGKPMHVAAGTRLAQFIVLNSNVPDMIEVNELPKTERGEDGFGSSGK